MTARSCTIAFPTALPTAFTTALALALMLSALAATPAFAQSSAPASAASSEGWRDRIDVFVGLDGSKQPQDLGINANMGPRFAANIATPLVRAAGLGIQFGTSVNLSDAAVHVLDQVEGTSRRTQVFTTVGVFQRTGRLSWSLGYDALRQFYYDDVWLGQWRGEVNVAMSDRDQIGVWFTAPASGSDAAVGDVSAGGTALRLDPIGQASVVARHTWATGARTGVWVGVARGHHNVVLVFPDNSRSRNVLVCGAELLMPLNDRWAITGATNLITPTATGTVDAFMGVTVNLGRRGTGTARFGPMLGVANNTSFAVDLERR